MTETNDTDQTPDEDGDQTAREITLQQGDANIPLDGLSFTTDDEDDTERIFKRAHGDFEVEFSVDLTAPPRDIERAFTQSETVRISVENIPGMESEGEYRRCHYCDHDSFVEVGHYEDHLQKQHNIER